MFKRFRRRTTHTFNVLSLDGTILTFELESRSTGADVLERALEASGVHEEKDFFGLVCPSDQKETLWLSLRKPLKKQLPGRSPYSVNLRVCMYPRDNQSMTLPSTRHLLYLQIKQDMYKGTLECSNAEQLHRIAGLALQAEIGDFSALRCGLTYVSDFELIPVLTRSTEEAISQLHRQNRGRASIECETELLDIVQELPTYGTITYNAQDRSRQPVTLCVSPNGIKVIQRYIERASFEWDSIESISSRGKAMTLHVSGTHTLAPYQVQYFCQSSSMVQVIATHCQYLLENYCIAVAEAERPKSRLRRWFSSRRSFRRRPSPMRRHFKDSNGQTRHVSGRRASFGGDLGSPPMTTVTASSRMSLRATSRTDSKLVIYGAGGLASPSRNPAQATPNHHTLKVETHQIEPANTTPSHSATVATPTRKDAPPPHRGSIGDVEHKSVSSVLKNHAQTSPTTGATRRPSNASLGQNGERRRSFLQEVGSPTRSMVTIGSRDDKYSASPMHTSASNTSFNPHKLLNDYQPPPKREWYHDDVMSPSEKRSFSDISRDKRLERAGSTSEVPSRSTGQRYKRQDSNEALHKYTHSSSTEHFSRAKGSTTSSSRHDRTFEHSQSVDHIEREARKPLPNKHRQNYQQPRQQEVSRHTGQTRSSKSSSDISAHRKKSSSLPRDAPYKLEEEGEPEGQSSSHHGGRNRSARPGNRGHFRLSLPESSYYDAKLAGRHSNARRSRRTLTSTGLSNSGSLSQPNDFGLGGLSSKLGSIASLEYQASFAELSQSDITTVIDPHTRSFIFEGSQTNSQGTAL